MYTLHPSLKGKNKKAGIILYAIAIIVAFLFWKLLAKALDDGNISRCKEYQKNLKQYSRAYVAIDTIKTCELYNINLQ